MFETLDTKTGRVYLGENKYIGVIDTVGFINNIPTQLIESFKATLEELFYADVLINVVDISDIDYKNKERITIKTLRMANVSEEKIKENKLYVSDLKFIENDNQLYEFSEVSLRNNNLDLIIRKN